MFEDLAARAIRFNDTRGYVEVLYDSPNMVLKRSFSHAGVFRGMHIQLPPNQQVKLIRVTSGTILDFLIRPNELPTRIWHRKLSSKDGWIKINADMAHGFYAVTDTHFEYVCDGRYSEESEVSYSILGYLEEVMGLTNVNLSEKDSMARPVSWRSA